MHCRACDSERAKFISEWEEWYCKECVDAIMEVIVEDEDLEEYYEQE